jgi:serine/threonine protein kinase
MAVPTTSEDLLNLMRKSGVIEENRLTGYIENHKSVAPLPENPRELADSMIRDGVLTFFQAEQFMHGRWRRFTIGKYKVLEHIGSGGMGSVYLCEHKFMRRRAAIKVLPAAKAADPSALERFYREARAVAALDHPNIVRAYDVDVEENLHYLVMEYVDGSSLIEIVKKVGPISHIRIAHYISQSALGLQHAHEAANLVHRDIKPGNIIVDRNGAVKVLDLGLARFFKDEDDMLTKKFDENVLGTADYLAPEQVLDSHSVDIRADVYSLGATAYYCLTGLTPFGEGTVSQKLIWHQTRKPKSILSIRPDMPPSFVAVIEKMMAKNPADRYQTPADVAVALKPWTASPIPPPPAIEMPQLSLAAQGIGPTGGLVPSSDSAMQPTYSGQEAETFVPRRATMTPVMPSPRAQKLQEDSDSPLERTAYEKPRPRKVPASPGQRPAKVPPVLKDRPVTPVKQPGGQEAKRPGKPTAPSQAAIRVEDRLAAPNPFEIEFPARRPEPKEKPPDNPASNWKATALLFVVVAVVTFIGLWVATGQQLPFLHR